MEVAMRDATSYKAADEHDVPDQSLPRHIVQSVEHGVQTPPYTVSPPSDPSKAGLRQTSEAPSSSALSSVATPNRVESAAIPNAGSTPTTSSRPAKRRKLNPAEKEEQRLLKEAKDKLREDKKLQQDQERAARDEERRLKAEERRAKNEEKEMKRREIELAKQAKTEAEQKKARSQLRLTSLFTKPNPPTGDAAVAPSGSADKIVLETFDAIVSQTSQAVNSKMSPPPTLPPETSDYRKYFLPFYLPSHSKLAPNQFILRSDAETEAAMSDFDAILANKDGQARLPEALSHPRNARSTLEPRVSDVITAIQGGLPSVPGYTDDARRPQDILENVLMRHLQFAEDVRPPYFGSYTKITDTRQATKLARSPFSRIRTDTNYDYDSEAEWDEPEEGEDIGSDCGDDEAESVDSGGEMDAFLDDDDDAGRPKPRQPLAELVPICTNMNWEDAHGKTSANDAPFDLGTMRLEWLLDLPNQAINPYSTSYWEEEKAPTTLSTGNGTVEKAEVRSNPWAKPMAPPAKPDESTIIGAAQGLKGPIMAVKKPRAQKSSAPKLIGESLEQFKDAVDGSNLSKAELTKALKERFPTTKIETLKETLNSYCARVGATAENKVWRFIPA